MTLRSFERRKRTGAAHASQSFFCSPRDSSSDAVAVAVPDAASVPQRAQERRRALHAVVCRRGERAERRHAHAQPHMKSAPARRIVMSIRRHEMYTAK
eukprot:1275894-Rhodomonas_salina.1